jgi:hypothetical protein
MKIAVAKGISDGEESHDDQDEGRESAMTWRLVKRSGQTVKRLILTDD